MHVVQDHQCHSFVFLLYFTTKLIFPFVPSLPTFLEVRKLVVRSERSSKSQVHHRRLNWLAQFHVYDVELDPTHSADDHMPIDLSSVQPLRRRVLIVYPIMHMSSDVYREERIPIEEPTGVIGKSLCDEYTFRDAGTRHRYSKR